MNMNLKEEFKKRWFLNQFSDEKIFEIYNKWWESFYVWFDPSANSLQLGNMCAIMAAVNLMKYWNKCYFLVWWATWMIWDPSWKSDERNFLWEEKLRENEANITLQLKSFLDNLKSNYWINFDYEMVNNYDFYKNMNYLEFLTNVGKYITINQMSAKESVKKRLIDPDKSISYTEFSYMLIQWYDFLRLYEDKWTKLQLWWSDQWWNITTWIELIRKKTSSEVYGLTIPIITDSTGKKFGKSEWNAIWLDINKNTPYFVYQYFMNTNDDDVEKYLKVLTLLSFEEIEKITQKHSKSPENRLWQKELAKNVVEIIFGKEKSISAEKISELFFGKNDKLNILKQMTKDEITDLKKETWWMEYTDKNISEILVEIWLTKSKWESKKMIQSWSIYLNEEKINDIWFSIKKSDLINNQVCILRKGKKNFKIIYS